MPNKQSVLGFGARRSGTISNANSLELNVYVEAAVGPEKVKTKGDHLWLINKRF